jgi:hypothetical protein
LRLLTRPPLRPFSRLARCLASLRTNPPSLPRGQANSTGEQALGCVLAVGDIAAFRFCALLC